MFHDPLLNNGIGHSKLFATNCTVLHPFDDMVLHSSNLFIAILGFF